MTFAFTQAFGLFFLLVAFVALVFHVIHHRRKVAYARSRANHPAGRGR